MCQSVLCYQVASRVHACFRVFASRLNAFAAALIWVVFVALHYLLPFDRACAIMEITLQKHNRKRTATTADERLKHFTARIHK